MFLYLVMTPLEVHFALLVVRFTDHYIDQVLNEDHDKGGIAAITE